MTVARCGFICVQQRIRRRHVAVEICTGTLPQRYKRSAKPLARSSVIILVQGRWSHRPPLMYP